MQDEYSFSAGEFRCLAARSDPVWGNGLKVSVFDHNGRLLNVVHFGCHPERPGYDELQAMPTGQLIELAAQQLQIEDCRTSLASVRQEGLVVYLALQAATN